MILVDSSVWIDHFRKANPILQDDLSEALVLTHPFIIGELACGNLTDRARVLEDLLLLPAAHTASDDEVRHFIEGRRLWGNGIGWVDAHLIASALLTNCDLWTLDTALARAASSAGVGVRAARR